MLKDPAASRMHGTVASVPGGWTYTNQSNEGTFLDGRRITSKKFDDRTALRLGHPVAGPELALVPILSAAEEEKRIARRRSDATCCSRASLAGVLVLILGDRRVAVLLGRDDGDDDPSGDATSAPTIDQTDSSNGTGSPDEVTDEELDAAKAATVRIIAESHSLENPDEEFVYGGSGSIIRSDGLILTNAHVAAPETPGIVEQYGPEAAIADPEYLLISLTDGATDTTSDPEYRARVVEADGVLDAAVIQIYANADGSELDGELDLPAIRSATPPTLRAGDDVTVLGFPGPVRIRPTRSRSRPAPSRPCSPIPTSARTGSSTPTRGSRPATPAAWPSTTAGSKSASPRPSSSTRAGPGPSAAGSARSTW